MHTVLFITQERVKDMDTHLVHTKHIITFAVNLPVDKLQAQPLVRRFLPLQRSSQFLLKLRKIFLIHLRGVWEKSYREKSTRDTFRDSEKA